MICFLDAEEILALPGPWLGKVRRALPAYPADDEGWSRAFMILGGTHQGDGPTQEEMRESNRRNVERLRAALGSGASD